ncbi:hypothetical protein ABEX78_22095 [Priestia megaterium]
MKKFITTFTLSTLLVPALALSTSTVTKVEAAQEKYEIPSLTLTGEKYDGKALIRTLRYDDTDKKGRKYIEFINVPKVIQEKVKTKDPEAVQEVTALLAQYYNSDEVNNIVGLNELLLQFIPEIPKSKISISKDYAPTASENLNSSLDYIKKDEELSVSKEDKEVLYSSYNDSKPFLKNFTPYSNKEELYKVTEKYAEDLRVKWYENALTYIIAGIVVVVAIVLFIFFRRR